MKVTVDRIGRENEEALIVRCHDPGARLGLLRLRFYRTGSRAE